MGATPPMIDCDANATYAPDRVLCEILAAEWGNLGNPSALHRAGQRARARIEDARVAVRALVGARPESAVVFTSGATEANNTCIAAGALRTGRLISSQLEHPCVREPLRALGNCGREVVLLAPSSTGEIEVSAVAEALAPETALVSLMAANNETGVLTAIEAVTECVRQSAPQALIHTDAAQLVGKGDVNFERLGVDLLTLSAHKIGGLSGVGAIVVRSGIDLAPLLRGGPQEGKVRAGTENVLGIVAFGVVAELVRTQLAERICSMRRVRDEFEQLLLTSLPECAIQGANAARLPNTSSVYIPGIRGDDLVVALDLQGILISSGAACSSGKPEPSHVLLAMGVGEAQARSTVRVSFRADHSPEVPATVVAAIERVVARSREVGRSR